MIHNCVIKLLNRVFILCMYGFYLKHSHENTISAQIYNTTTRKEKPKALLALHHGSHKINLNNIMQQKLHLQLRQLINKIKWKCASFKNKTNIVDKFSEANNHLKMSKSLCAHCLHSSRQLKFDKQKSNGFFPEHGAAVLT
jgi:hypothetical protein